MLKNARLTSPRLALFRLPALAAIGAVAVGCGSSQPTDNSCPSSDGLWNFPNCIVSEYVYVGQPGVPCTTPDGLYYRADCANAANQVLVGTPVQPGVTPVTPTTPGVTPVTPITPGVTPVTPITPGVTPTGVTPGVTPVTPGTEVTPGVTPVTPGVTPVTPGVTPVTPGTTTEPPPPPPPVEATNRTCPAYGGLIADFEEAGDNQFRTVEAEGRIGILVANNDDSATQTFEVLEEGAEACNNKVLHTSGSGFGEGSWSGLETVLTGVWDDAEAGYTPNPYDAAALGYDGIAFRAKKGAGHANPVKFSLSVPGSRAEANGGDGTCSEGDETNPDACWNHPGHYLIDDEELGTDWKTYTFCINGDLYPTWMPFVLSSEQRAAASTELMTVGFEFNKDSEASPGDAFDFYVDDIRLVKDACNAGAGVFQSTAGTAVPFGTNGKVGTCDPVPNAGDYNRAISEAYARWKAKFVANDGGVVDPDEGNRVVSEAIGYGMLITAAMGDKETFDKIWGWASSKIGNPPTALLGWLNGGNGSASDADTDMAYALLMAAKQWGGNYAAAGNALAALALQKDVQGGVVFGGENFKTAVNPSYYSPGFYRKFSGWEGVITGTKSVLDSCSQSFGGLLPDWCSSSGQAIGAAQTGAQVTAASVCASSDAPCLAYDGVRVPWRLGFDVCTGGSTSALLQSFISKLKTSTEPDVKNGARMDLVTAGWSASGPNADGSPNAMAFLGPVAVGAWALGSGEAATRDRAFRATLDVIQNPEYYEVYYQSTVALLSLLTMTGNWPTP
jgi:endo-1,4-beta-D-glucanase Y